MMLGRRQICETNAFCALFKAIVWGAGKVSWCLHFNFISTTVARNEQGFLPSMAGQVGICPRVLCKALLPCYQRSRFSIV